MNEQIVIAIGSAISFGIIIKLTFNKMMMVISSYQKDIQNNLNEAQKIQHEAKLLFEKYQKQQNELPIEISKILSQAKDEADRIVDKAQKIAKKNADLKTAIAKKKIDNDGDQLLQEFDKRFISLTFDAIKNQAITRDSDNIIDGKYITENIKNFH
jgi:F0F1-type ATP synthase membrane subunit b/b'